MNCPDLPRTTPQLSDAHAHLTHEVSVLDERGRASTISIPAERPLTVYVDKRELVTLMTLGGAPEALTLGYLRNQRLVRAIEDVVSVQVDWAVDAVAVVTRNGIADVEERTAKKVVTTGCGQGSVFGGLMDEVETISLSDTARLAQSVVYRIVDTIRTQQSIYKQAGSVHGCALFSNTGELLYFVEDVGRHNAVDAIAGLMWLEGVKGDDKVFYTTGRLTSEMVIKGAQMGIPFLLSRSGTTQMGHMVAQKVGMSLLARCSGKHFLLLSGQERLLFEPELVDVPHYPPQRLSGPMSLFDATAHAFALLFSGDAALWRIIWVSLKTSVIGLLLAAPPAVLLGYAIAMHRFPGRRIVVWLAQCALSLPTVLIGLLLYLLLSRRGPLGPLEWLFSQPGIIAGQFLVGLPVLLAFTLAAVQGLDARYAETARALGASRWRVMTTVLHEARYGVMAAVISGFGRVISEVGCALMVGGNIEGETRTITTAIALETSKGEFAQGIALGIVLVALALLMNGALMLLQGEAHTAGGRA